MDITRILIGIGLAMGMHVLLLIAMVALLFVIPGGVSLKVFLAIGAVQWIYMLPVLLYCYRTQRKEFVLGILMVAGMTIFWNVLYYLALIFQ